MHTSNPVLNVERWSKAKSTARFRHSSHTWKHSGVLISDVKRIMNHGKVALIECELQEAIRMVHAKEKDEHIKFNYIYMRPQSVEELATRLIRNYQLRESMISIR